MTTAHTMQPAFSLRFLACIGLVGLCLLVFSRDCLAQPPDPAPAAPSAIRGTPPQMPSVWELAVQGGIFMIPIALCSIVALSFSIERLVGLRQRVINPPQLMASLRQLQTESTGIDPRQAYEVCQADASPLARVLRAAILKVGRPHAELEKSVEDAVAREGDAMAQNIRPINVAASLSPLIGLLGTVQGMILAFMVTSATTSTGSAKAQELAQGIYTALVTTFAGLSVAIPAVFLANLLEGRIDRLLREMEDFFLEILPQFERFEGKLRVTRKSGSEGVLLKGTSPQTPRSAAVSPAKTSPAVASKPAVKPSADSDPEAEALETVPEHKSLWGVMGSREKASLE